jgi:hypothetical protein
VGGGVQLGQLGTAATNRPIVPAPGDCDDGEIGGMIGRGNRSTRRKPAPLSLCPPETPRACSDAKPGHRGSQNILGHSPVVTSVSNGIPIAKGSLFSIASKLFLQFFCVFLYSLNFRSIGNF